MLILFPHIAITFVALGTSLPDTFASKAAAVSEKYADNAIGNVTGSNSVNVFLGLGLPWMIASIYHAAKVILEKEAEYTYSCPQITPKGSVFRVQSGSLGFSVTLYSIVSLLAVALLVLRRQFSLFGRAELGGPTLTRYVTALILVMLWFTYVSLSAMQSYGHL